MGLEDIGIMRLFPNTIVTVPADAISTRVITEAIMKVYGPAYIRLGKTVYYKVFDKSYRFEIGKANLLVEGYDATIITNGSMVCRSLEACKKLKNEGIQIRVLEMPCVKPIDEVAIISAARDTGAIVTAEDHTIIGGLGGAVAEILSEQYPTIMKRLGIRDVFPESGNHNDLLDKYGLAVYDVMKAVKEVIKKKSK
jgi:transketolase